MFIPAAIEQVKNCDPDEKVTFVVQWTGSAEIAAGLQGGSRRDRLSKLKLALREVKRDVLDRVRSEDRLPTPPSPSEHDRGRRVLPPEAPT